MTTAKTKTTELNSVAVAKSAQKGAVSDLAASARDYAKRAAETILDRSTAIESGVEKSTNAVEQVATQSIAGAAKISREVQTAVFVDARAALVAFEEMLAAPSLPAAARVHVDFLRGRFAANVARTKDIALFLARSVENGAKLAQDNLTKITKAEDKAA